MDKPPNKTLRDMLLELTDMTPKESGMFRDIFSNYTALEIENMKGNLDRLFNPTILEPGIETILPLDREHCGINSRFKAQRELDIVNMQNEILAELNELKSLIEDLKKEYYVLIFLVNEYY